MKSQTLRKQPLAAQPLPPLPSWYPNNPPEGVIPLPASTVVPQIAAYVIGQLPEFLYQSAWAPANVDVILYEDPSVEREQDPQFRALQSAVWTAEKAIARRFVAVLQASPVWNQLRAEVTAALTAAMTP